MIEEIKRASEEIREASEETDHYFLEWTDEFENMVEDNFCLKCDWEPDSEDFAISYSPKKYSYYLSLESSFPQYVWSVIYQCPNCETIFKGGSD